MTNQAFQDAVLECRAEFNESQQVYLNQIDEIAKSAKIKEMQAAKKYEASFAEVQTEIALLRDELRPNVFWPVATVIISTIGLAAYITTFMLYIR